MSSERLQLSFFSPATQYYVTGRFGVLAGQMPVAGNLLHHAIEMYIKGALAKTMSLKQLKGLFHSLPDLWTTFKAESYDTSSASFDTLITSLHTFEELRYPDSSLTRGMAVTAGITRGASVGLSAKPEIVSVPTYEIYLDEIDALVGHIFKVASINPVFFISKLNARPREYLRENNSQPWAT